MKRLVCATICCLLLAAALVSASDTASNSGVVTGGGSDDKLQVSALSQEMVQDLLNQVSGDASSVNTPTVQGVAGSTGACVEVNVELPDTVGADTSRHSTAEGSFDVTNCSDSAEVILLGVKVSVRIPTVVDTSFTFREMPIRLGAGKTMSHRFRFPMLSFDAMFTVCLTARIDTVVASACDSTWIIGKQRPGIPVHVTGVLTQGTDCVVLAPMGTHQHPLLLDNYGTFAVGDTVGVKGQLYEGAQESCPEAMGLIKVDSIFKYVAPEQPTHQFKTAGVLTQGTDCVVFTPFACKDHQPEPLLLENYGEFVVGDTVFVAGEVVRGAQETCPEAKGIVKNNTIEKYSVPQPSVPFEGVGVLVQGTECVVFVPRCGHAAYLLENYDTYVVGDTVKVKGKLYLGSQTGCPEANGKIAENTIEKYVVQQPSVPFEGIGVLTQGTDCIVFVGRDGHGSYLLENYGTFVVGDTVKVAGKLYMGAQAECAEATGKIAENTIEKYTQPVGIPYEGTGVLEQGTDCIVFKPFWMHSFALVLENYGTFVAGDTVKVKGQLVNGAQEGCPEATGKLVGNTIEVPPAHPTSTSGSGAVETFNHPNPFNPTTTIRFSMPSAAPVSLTIYNVMGQTVRTLVSNEVYTAGSHAIVWNGTDGSGSQVGSGIYFYRLTVGDQAVSKKMMLLK